MQARRGELIDAFGDGGLVADLEGEPVGLVCWRIDRDSKPRSAELTCLVVSAGARGHGVGRALLDAAAHELRGVGVSLAWLVTTNDNLAALALYQKAGYRLTALHAGAVDATRRTIKPTIGEVGEHGIPLRDELELAKAI
jgi:ribosomal protein S18 acetylase RimI-like enzyme